MSEKRKRLYRKWLWLLLCFGGFILAGFLVGNSELLDVDNVKVFVDGEETTSFTETQETIKGLVGESMLFLDFDSVVKRLKLHPRVEEVNLKREWPRTVMIQIITRVGVVNAIDFLGGSALLDSNGVVLQYSDQPESSLPSIRVDSLGVPGSQMLNLTPLLRAAKAVTPDLLPWIVVLVPTGDGVNAELIGNVNVRFGLTEDYYERMRSLAAVLTWVELSCIELIDVRIPQNPAVIRSKSGC